MKPEEFRSYGLCLLIALAPCVLSAQEKQFDGKDLGSSLLQARLKSEQLRKEYSWNVRTDVTKDGKVMDIMIEDFSYGPDGKLIRKIVNDQEAKMPSSFLVHQVAEEIKGKMISFMNSLHLFLEQYKLEDPQKFSDFYNKATIGLPDTNGRVLISCNNVIVPGDRVLWWIDIRTFSVVRTSISTVFEGDQVEFSSAGKYLPPGLQYMAFAEILVPAKSIMVQLHFYDFMKRTSAG